jgi:hypothetical protein
MVFLCRFCQGGGVVQPSEDFMATESSSESAASGGLLVILGVVVALVAGYLFFQYAGRRQGPDITINAELPRPASPAPGNQ